MRRFFRILSFFLLTVGLLVPCPLLRGESAEEKILSQASLSFKDEIPILHLQGNAYEIGYQHGRFLRKKVAHATDQILSYFAKKLKVPILGTWIVNRILDRSYRKLEPYLPFEYQEEMRGLADGSGVSLKKVHRVHAVPDLYSTLCASGAFFGKATQNGRLYHLRNLDWNREIGIQDYLCLFVVKKTGKIPFVNIGYVSFIGSLSGMNEKGISIGQIGSKTQDETLKGTSMPLLLRKVLEEAQNLDQAIRIIEDAKRTIGCNYILADAKNKRACALETTQHHSALFYPNDPKEKISPYAVSVEDGVMRSDFAVDPEIRNLQTCAHGNPKKPGLEDPRGSGAYDQRYRNQAVFVKERLGTLDNVMMIELAKTIAPPSNVQSVIYSFPKFWVATAKRKLRAVDSGYHEFDLARLLQES